MTPDSPGEAALRHGLVHGTAVVFDESAEARTIRAEFLRDLLVGSGAAEGKPRFLKVSGARILGHLELEGASVDLLLNLTSCEFLDDLCLRDADLRGLRLTGSTVRGMDATNLTVRGTLYMNEKFVAGEKVSLEGAQIGGDVRLDRSIFHRLPEDSDHGDATDVALLANRLRVDGSFFAHDMEADGQVRMIGARIGGLMSFSGAKLRNPGRVALQAERATVGEDIFFQSGFEADGGVKLQNAIIGGGIAGLRARFSGSGEMNLALNLVRARVGLNIAMSEAIFDGLVSMRSAAVGGAVIFKGAKFEDEEATLNMSGFDRPDP